MSASRTSICSHCGDRIGWGKSVNNRPQPINADGSNHFATCSAMKRTPKAFPADCAACGSENLDVRPGTGPHAGALYCVDCGRFIKWLSKSQYIQIEGGPHAAVPEAAPQGAQKEPCIYRIDCKPERKEAGPTGVYQHE